MTEDRTPSMRPTAVVVNDDGIQLALLAGLLRAAGLEVRTYAGAEGAMAPDAPKEG